MVVFLQTIKNYIVGLYYSIIGFFSNILPSMDDISGFLSDIWSIIKDISSFVSGIPKFFEDVWDFVSGIPAFLDRFFDFVVSYVKELPIVLLDKFLSAVSVVINEIFSLFPLDFISVFNDFSSVASTLGYFMSPFKIGTGLGFILSAYVIRFLIRRIPIIG